ncbi:HTH-type transcriptional repressor YtrA [Caulifigura coniformis]|uniref:HTH-type transcriptional repressor YtrA n=1 Tax=Caulifigura coniformis TaxID=2527983 RepID=A0A517SIX8_9PLAN|nr:GntR family transcriptional regulator [Caulifigura coniformis]QDT56059.1 HTH-type transcriptional repressor YtrA [Caulifigura coniformis]
MLAHVDPSNGIPIYEQIVRQVKFAIADGSLNVGDHVPSVRELASRLAINPNTVARAYRDLQIAGLLLPIRGTGLAVAQGAPRQCRSERLDLIRERLRAVLSEAVHNGVSHEEIRSLMESVLVRLPEREGGG